MDFVHLLLTGIVLLGTICVLVAAHEYGHYLFARLFGMGVEEFAIGFGRKPIWTWMKKTYAVEPYPAPAGKSEEAEPESEPVQYSYPTDGSGALQPEPVAEPSVAPAQVKMVTTETTDFTVRPWPLGGFVRIKGMMPEDDGSETKVPGGFYSKAPWKRFIVLLAGPVFSILAGIIIFIGVYWVSGKAKFSSEPVLGTVTEKSAAKTAGLEPGDRIVAINGEKIDSFYELTQIVSKNGEKEITIVFSRNGKTSEVKATPKTSLGPVMKADGDFTDDKVSVGRLGVLPKDFKQRLSFGEAVQEGFKIPGDVVGKLATLVRKPAELKEAVGGPGSIAMATSEATKDGIESVITLAAALSISVGIFNLLPIFPLDGGQMLMAVIEMFRRGKRLSMKVQGAVSAVGLALVAMLFVSVILIDVGRMTGKGKDEKPNPPKVEKPK